MIERFARLHVAVEERVNLKRVHRRLQTLAKLLIVTTFIEDALRVLTTFSVQRQSMEIAGWKSTTLHTLLPALSFVIQSSAALMVVLPSSSRRPEVGCYMLICWCTWHPIMYGQHRNWEFVLETATIMGGLLILLSHFMLLRPSVLRSSSLLLRADESLSSAGDLQQRAARLQAFGRVLIVSIFVYIAADKVISRDGRCDGTCAPPVPPTVCRSAAVRRPKFCPSAPPTTNALVAHRTAHSLLTLRFPFPQAHSWAVQRSFGPNDGPGVWGWETRLVELGISLVLLYLCSLVVIGMKVSARGMAPARGLRRGGGAATGRMEEIDACQILCGWAGPSLPTPHRLCESTHVGRRCACASAGIWCRG
jgi:hypothetical protein